MSDAVTSWDDAFTHVLWRAQNAVHRRVQEALDELGVTVTQLGLAVHLDQLGPLSAADLSRGFHIAPQSVGTALNRLEKVDWVRRRTHPVHGRVVLYELTATGLAGVARGRQVMAATNAGVTADLSVAETAQLIELLRKVTVGIDGAQGPMMSAWPVRRG
ncbi:MarR family winged helix-turn-helix transcriptional regulator [Streptomyces shenzhenensis]|uniref:MarR family winged helix-turn-helix transcriptional regulator n=1 Tax=Streptomyces shenzhenensis TaxID=943815 RepID=UPI0036C0C57D